MSKVGKRYKRTDELPRTTIPEIDGEKLIAVYDVDGNEEFAVDADSFVGLNPTEDFIPVRRDSAFHDSPLQVLYDGEGNPVEIVSSVALTVPSGTVRLGGLVENGQLIRGVSELKDGGDSLLNADNVTGNIGTVPITDINDNLTSSFGVGKTRFQEGTTFVWSSFGGTDTDTATVSGDQKITLTFQELETAFITAQRIRGTQGKMDYRVFDITTHDGVDTLVYTTEQGAPIDFDSAVGPDFQIEYNTVNPNYLIQDHLLRLEFFSRDGSPMTMKGQASGPVNPPGGDDITNFIPFFETKFSIATERIVYPNSVAVYVNSDTTVRSAFQHAVDTSSNTVLLTLNPDDVQLLEVFDESRTFATNNCSVKLLLFNTRTTPNDAISSTVCDTILADNVDAGASGTKIMLSLGGVAKVFNNGTNWVVIMPSETLNFDQVTARSGRFNFRILGSKAVLTVGANTQSIDNILDATITVDGIGNVTNTIDEIFHLETFLDGERTFDDTITDQTIVLDEDGARKSFYFRDNVWTVRDMGGETRMRWRDRWLETETYETFDTVLDNEWTMVANKQTTDRAAPEAVGDAQFQLDETPPFADQNTANVVAAGQKFTAAFNGVASQIRVWPAEVGPNISHFLQATFNPDSDNPTQIRTPIFNLVADEWNVVSFINIFALEGTVLQLELVHINSSATTSFTYPWVFGGTSTNNLPVSGEWNRRSNNRVRINDLDDNAVDRTSDLSSVVPGSTIEFVQQSDNSRRRTYNVLSVSDEGTAFSYDATLESSSNTIQEGQVCDCKVTIPVAGSINYSEAPNYWLSNTPPSSSFTKGILTIGTGATVESDNAYGADIRFQQVEFSDDWDILSVIGDGGFVNSAPQTLQSQSPVDGNIYLTQSGGWVDLSNISIPHSVTEVNTNYTIVENDDFIFVDASGGALTITLPTAVGISGQSFTIKKVDTTGSNVTIDGDGTETIDDSLTQVITKKYDSVTVTSNGAEWYIT